MLSSEPATPVEVRWGIERLGLTGIWVMCCWACEGPASSVMLCVWLHASRVLMYEFALA